MVLLSKCEMLIGSSFSIARGLNGHGKQALKHFNIFCTGGRFCLFHETLKLHALFYIMRSCGGNSPSGWRQ